MCSGGRSVLSVCVCVYVCLHAPQAVESVLRGEVQAAVTVVRPPGHHAECARAQGFCFFNNVAVAARAALTHPGDTHTHTHTHTHRNTVFLLRTPARPR